MAAVTSHARPVWVGTAAERAGVAPPADAIGTRYFATDTGDEHIWDGSAWQLVSSTGSGSSSGNYILGETLLDETAGSGGQAYFEKGSIGSGYLWIDIFLSGKTEKSDGVPESVFLNFNDDTTNSNYQYVRHYGYSSGHTIAEGDGRYIALMGTSQDTAYVSGHRITIYDPKSSAFHKVAKSIGGYRYASDDAVTEEFILWWENTAAITKIKLVPETNDFAEGTRCLMIGYKEVTISVPS